MDTFNKVWTSPETLPTRDEFASPQLWLERVDRPGLAAAAAQLGRQAGSQMGPHPAVAAVRQAVRRALAPLAPGDLVLAACSGGADSLALAAALAFEAPRLGLRGGGVTVDHGLQAGSAEPGRAGRRGRWPASAWTRSRPSG